MANYFPLIVNAVNSTIDELPSGDNLDLTGSNVVNAGNISANFFIGNGSSLSSIAGANVTGAVTLAVTANAVAGANVTGAVAYATTANAVAGKNNFFSIAETLV